MLKDIFPGTQTSSITEITPVGDRIFFAAEDPDTGQELWVSDGAPGGTFLVKNINYGEADANIRDMIAFNGFVYFSATDYDHGQELWRSDGTSTGTILVKDILTGENNSSYPLEMTVFGSQILFKVLDGTNKLWLTDGTEGGTQPIVVSGLTGAQDFFVQDDIVYFQGMDSANGDELWKTDGTAGGTILIKDIRPSFDSSNPFGFVEYNGLVYFIATENGYSHKLWKTDGTNAGTVIVSPDQPYDIPGNSYAIYKGWLYFIGMPDSPQDDWEMWRTDGTAENTAQFMEFNQTGNDDIDGFVQYGDYLFFVPNDGVHGKELWFTDGTVENTRLAIDLDYASPANPILSINWVNIRTFLRMCEPTHGCELWTMEFGEHAANLPIITRP